MSAFADHRHYRTDVAQTFFPLKQGIVLYLKQSMVLYPIHIVRTNFD